MLQESSSPSSEDVNLRSINIAYFGKSVTVLTGALVDARALGLQQRAAEEDNVPHHFKGPSYATRRKARKITYIFNLISHYSFLLSLPPRLQNIV